jgi:hypothetical protein
MVSHELNVQGVSMTGVAQNTPALLQMNDNDFPAQFTAGLGALAPQTGSSVTTLATSPFSPVTLYQPVQRIVHLALLQLTCNTVGTPRLDPARIESAGVVIRRIVRKNGVDDLAAPPSAWMKSADGQLGWVALNRLQECDDPDPAKRPQLQSGQPELDRLLATQSLLTAQTEAYSPAFVAAPAVCDRAGRTFVYGVLPTASSEVNTNPPSPPQYDSGTLTASLPTLLQAGSHTAPLPDQIVNYQFMSDDFVKANSFSGFLTFSLTLRMMYTVFGAFDNSPQARNLIDALNQHSVYFLNTVNGEMVFSTSPMGAFYQSAASALIDFDPTSGQGAPALQMPHAWDAFSDADAASILSAITSILQARSAQVLAPLGRFQDATRLYRIRVFLRINGETPGCPPRLIWSQPSDPFRIAAWHESAGRPAVPVPLPDPTDRNFLKSATPNCSFAVPPGLMNAMQGTSMADLSSGSAGPSSGVQLGWICGFNIPLITICAFFVLNIFLSLLNLVFFWLPFVKICIPFPTPTPANSGDSDGN